MRQARYGYHTTYHHGGVIRENGQEVLIHYLWDEESGSVYILQIYELSKKYANFVRYLCVD